MSASAGPQRTPTGQRINILSGKTPLMSQIQQSANSPSQQNAAQPQFFLSGSSVGAVNNAEQTVIFAPIQTVGGDGGGQQQFVMTQPNLSPRMASGGGQMYKLIQMPSCEPTTPVGLIPVPVSNGNMIFTTQEEANLLSAECSGQQVFVSQSSLPPSPVIAHQYLSAPEVKETRTNNNALNCLGAEIDAGTQQQGQPFSIEMTSQGQCFVIIDPTSTNSVSSIGGRQVVSSTSSAGGGSHNKFQQATFIPLSRLDSFTAPNISGQATSPGDKSPGPAQMLEPFMKGKRRASHNEVEKRRRDKINAWIDVIQQILPDADEDISRSNVSKGVVLEKAVEYMKTLKESNMALLDSLEKLNNQSAIMITDKLREQNHHLQNENRTLKTKLKELEDSFEHSASASGSNNILVSCGSSVESTLSQTPPSSVSDVSVGDASGTPVVNYIITQTSFSGNESPQPIPLPSEDGRTRKRGRFDPNSTKQISSMSQTQESISNSSMSQRGHYSGVQPTPLITLSELDPDNPVQSTDS